jgi:hypothetical protein
LTLTPDAENFFYSRQKFQNILVRVELLAGEMEQDPNMSRETIKKNLDAILASSNDYARFLRDLQKYVEKEEVPPNKVAE